MYKRYHLAATVALEHNQSHIDAHFPFMQPPTDSSTSEPLAGPPTAEMLSGLPVNASPLLKLAT